MWCDLRAPEPWLLKSWALAMVQLLPRGLPFVLQGIEAVSAVARAPSVHPCCASSPLARAVTRAQIIAQVLDVLNQQALTAGYVSLSPDFEVISGKDRKRKAFVTDPVVTCDLRATLMSQLDVRDDAPPQPVAPVIRWRSHRVWLVWASWRTGCEGAGRGGYVQPGDGFC